jgi:hypothetical protein
VLNLTILHYNQITLSLSKDFTFWLGFWWTLLAASSNAF